MLKLTRHQSIALRVIALLTASFLLASCNLGQQAPTEPPEGIDGLEPQDLPELQVTATTAGELAPPTDTPVPELLASEQLGPITVDSTVAHRTQEPVTVRVQAGTQVSNITCSWVHQDTNQTGALGTPTQNAVDADTVENVYTFTPQLAGTFTINCTGVATTASGQRAVQAAGTPFNVEAKG